MKFQILVIKLLTRILHEVSSGGVTYVEDLPREAEKFIENEELTLPKREECIHHAVCKYDDGSCPMECGHFERENI